MKKLLAGIVWIALLPSMSSAGEISPTGSKIEVEDYQCTVTGPRNVQCINTGRLCAAYRAKKKAADDKVFGCAVEGSKNYPCKPWPDEQKRIEDDVAISQSLDKFGCTPIGIGPL